MPRLGKLPAKHDPKDRTIKFKEILKEPLLPALPEEYEFAGEYPHLDLSPKAWGNLHKGNCVVVASYAQQREFEVIEQGRAIDVDKDQLIKFYDKLSPQDNGLVMLDYNKVWKNDGIPIGYGKRILCMKRPLRHKIDAFTRIDTTNQKEIQYAIFLVGCNVGVAFPDNYADEYYADKPWKDTSLPPNRYKGHAMKPLGFNGDGVWFWTWGIKQFAYWDWVLKYTDEGWAMIDSINEWLGDQSPLDMDILRERLNAIEKM